MPIMKALSIRSPWWAWILYGGKTVENRDWYTPYRGTILIHASKFWREQNVKLSNGHARVMAKACGFTKYNPPANYRPFTFEDMRPCLGSIVGVADIVGCERAHPSPWFVGKFGFILDNVRPIKKPIPVKGALGFFPVEVTEDQLL